MPGANVRRDGMGSPRHVGNDLRQKAPPHFSPCAFVVSAQKSGPDRLIRAASVSRRLGGALLAPQPINSAAGGGVHEPRKTLAFLRFVIVEKGHGGLFPQPISFRTRRSVRRALLARRSWAHSGSLYRQPFSALAGRRQWFWCSAPVGSRSTAPS